MKYTQIPANTFKEIQMNAGIICSEFAPDTGAVTASNIVGATNGGTTFEAKPTFVDMGDGIDNCPKNTMELKKIDTWEATMSGSFTTVNSELAGRLLSASTVSGNKITPLADLTSDAFDDIWWIGDYSDVNTGTNAGFIAIHLMNALSTGGFKIKSADKDKGTIDFEFTAHYSIAEPDAVPFEIYVKGGASGSLPN